MDDRRFASNAYANAGTRILVQTIMEFLGDGDSIEEILEEYPSLKREDIYACIQFAASV
ncbi:MAG TPA: DUF433 domain-containing protein [Allocoleopsis sp.]